MKKNTYEYVKTYIEKTSESNCILLTKSYINQNQKLEIQCKCGSIFFTDFSTFKNKNKTKCDLCVGHVDWDCNKVKSYIYSKNGSELISKTYKNKKDMLTIKCICGSIFMSTFYNLKQRKNIICKKCESKRKSELLKHNYDYVKDFIENISESNCKLISKKYKNATFQKLQIKCKCGNLFNTTFNAFKDCNKRQCNQCGYKKLSYQKHSYEYVKNLIKQNTKCVLLSDEYTGSKDYNLSLQCACGNIFTTTFGIIKYSGKIQCNKCSNTHRYSLNEIKDIIENTSDCKLLDDKYKNNSTKIKLLCACGEIFHTTFGKFIYENKTQCNNCSGFKIYTLKDIEEYVKNNSKTKLLSQTYHNVDEPLDFQCECGEVFTTSFYTFKKYGKIRCDICTKKISNYELKVKNYLDKKNIKYEHQFKFNDLKYKKTLFYDFAILNNEGLKYLVEVNGIQHYEPVKFFGGQKTFERQKFRDKLKKEYASQKNIQLIVIPYWVLDNEDFEQSLDKLLNCEEVGYAN